MVPVDESGPRREDLEVEERLVGAADAAAFTTDLSLKALRT